MSIRKKHYESNNMQNTQKYATDRGAVWLTILSSAPAKQGHVSANEANELTRSRSAVPSAVLFDSNGNVGKRYSAKTTPPIFIVDKKGILRYKGAIDSIPSEDKADISKATNYVTKALGELIARKKISEPSSRPYGCAVKYGSYFLAVLATMLKLTV